MARLAHVTQARTVGVRQLPGHGGWLSADRTQAWTCWEGHAETAKLREASREKAEPRGELQTGAEDTEWVPGTGRPETSTPGTSLLPKTMHHLSR